MNYVLTLVAAQHHTEFKNNINQAVDEQAAIIEDISELHEGLAYDLYLESPSESLIQNLRNALQCDVFIQENKPETRRKKLFLSDMDATIVEEETLDELAAALGLKEKIAEITAATMRGELDFEASVKKRVAMLKDLPVNELENTFEHITYTKGARTLIKTLRAHNVHCTLVSGGFTYFTDKVAAELGFFDNFGNILGIDSGKLSGEVIPPIRGKEFKAQLLNTKVEELGLKLADTICAGDGANDADMLTLCQNNGGLGIGYRPKPALKKQLKNNVVYANLTSLLYAMGYKQDEIIFCEDE